MSACFADCATSFTSACCGFRSTFRPNGERRDHRNDDGRVGGGRWLHRRGLRSVDFTRRTLLSIFGFMFVQDPVLGAADAAFYPLEGYLIAKLQRIIRRLGRERVQKMRRLSGRIGETIAARREIRANHDAPYQLADIANRLGEIDGVGFEIYNLKVVYLLKLLNNIIGNLTPFFLCNWRIPCH